MTAEDTEVLADVIAKAVRVETTRLRDSLAQAQELILDLRTRVAAAETRQMTPGPQGERGLAGEIGPRGLQGEQGEPGKIGQQGEKGIDGGEGATGERGLQGPQGEPGQAGERGERGETGEAGPQGERGVQGDVGPRGLAGERGERGDPAPVLEQLSAEQIGEEFAVLLRREIEELEPARVTRRVVRDAAGRVQAVVEEPGIAQ